MNNSFIQSVPSFAVTCCLLATTACAPEMPESKQAPMAASALPEISKPVAEKPQKFAIDPETTEAVRRMQDVVTEFKDAGITDYRQLGMEILSETALLLQASTMEGEALSQFNNWLSVILEEAPKLQHPDPVVAAYAFNRIDTQLGLFDKYFV